MHTHAFAFKWLSPVDRPASYSYDWHRSDERLRLSNKLVTKSISENTAAQEYSNWPWDFQALKWQQNVACIHPEWYNQDLSTTMACYARAVRWCLLKLANTPWALQDVSKRKLLRWMPNCNFVKNIILRKLCYAWIILYQSSGRFSKRAHRNLRYWQEQTNVRKDETPVNLKLSSRPLGHDSLEYQRVACGLHECESHLPLKAGRFLLIEPTISCDSQKERINTQIN